VIKSNQTIIHQLINHANDKGNLHALLQNENPEDAGEKEQHGHHEE
jgi:hypothetical protein